MERGAAKILIVDDDRSYRGFLRRILQEWKEAEVIAEALDGKDAVDMARKLRPEVILMDIDMPRMDGLSATVAIKRLLPEVRVLILSSVEGDAYSDAAKRHGADGFVGKAAPLSVLLEKIRQQIRSARAA